MTQWRSVLVLLVALDQSVFFAVPQENAGANLSTVKTAELPVHSQTSLTSPVVKTLRQGDRVNVVLELTLSSGSWCRIREADQANSSGYVLCAQLDRPQPSDQRRWRLSPPQSSSVAEGARSPGPAGAEDIAKQSEVRQSLRDPIFWAEHFQFSDEQRRRSAGLQKDSGLAGCRDRVERMYRANGISDPASLLKVLGGLGKSASGIAHAGQIGAELDRCGVRYGVFWKQFVNLMNPEQKARLGKEPYLLLFLSKTLSDPGVEFGFYVLSQMRPR